MCDNSFVGLVQEVEMTPLAPERYLGVLSPPAAEAFRLDLDRARTLFEGHRVWNVNSTSVGGGVAEMLQSLVAYANGAGVDARWLVISGTPDFFTVTKRIHNQLHNYPGDGGPLGPEEHRVYKACLRENFKELRERVDPADVVILHDPQTAGLVPMFKRLGLPVVWRCHVGIDNPGEPAHSAWDFLRAYVRPADAYVFSRRNYAWEGLPGARIVLIPPSIDAFSPKNRDLDRTTVKAILQTAGLLRGEATHAPEFLRHDGSRSQVERRAKVYETRSLGPEDRVVLQVSRWDRLKDPLGVIRGFVEYVAPHSAAHLVYAGPAVEAISDDPEGQAVLAEALSYWNSLAPARQRQVHLATLPMADAAENAVIVNALQRQARVVVQKSIAEGFGLTVAEAMWKARPVVASRIGGIQDQVEDGRTGVLLDDPEDLARYGEKTLSLLQDDARARAMGLAAMERVRDQFLGARHLMQYVELLGGLLGTT